MTLVCYHRMLRLPTNSRQAQLQAQAPGTGDNQLQQLHGLGHISVVVRDQLYNNILPFLTNIQVTVSSIRSNEFTNKYLCVMCYCVCDTPAVMDGYCHSHTNTNDQGQNKT